MGIDLSNHNQSKSLLSRIIPTYKGKVEKPWQKGYEYSNVVLHPDLTEYSPISFKEWDKIFDIGYQLAIDNMPQILTQIENLKKTKKIKN